MTQEEILEYNKRCAEFLGYENTTPTDRDFNIYKNEKGIIIGNKIITMIELMSAKFHSDWNWIMEVIEKIENLGFATKIDHDYCVSNYGCDRCEIDTRENALFDPDEYEEKEEPIVFKLVKSKKEAVVYAINEFLIWYEQNKL